MPGRPTGPPRTPWTWGLTAPGTPAPSRQQFGGVTPPNFCQKPWLLPEALGPLGPRSRGVRGGPVGPPGTQESHPEDREGRHPYGAPSYGAPLPQTYPQKPSQWVGGLRPPTSRGGLRPPLLVPIGRAFGGGFWGRVWGKGLGEGLGRWGGVGGGGWGGLGGWLVSADHDRPARHLHPPAPE